MIRTTIPSASAASRTKKASSSSLPAGCTAPRAGSVGGVRNIKNVSLVSKAVMEHTGHVMLVGEGAERFAVAVGFPRENLLTEHSRKVWLLWKEFHSNEDWWGPGMADPHWKAPETKDKPQSELWRGRIPNTAERPAGARL